jgi:hypothetical protein
MLTSVKPDLVKLVCDAIISAVEASGSQGAPGGTLYAALMTYGFSLEQFEAIMGSLVRVGELEKRGQLYFRKSA